MADTKRQRPGFFNLAQIQMPVGALTSITHRITGVLLALARHLFAGVRHLLMDAVCASIMNRAEGRMKTCPWRTCVIAVAACVHKPKGQAQCGAARHRRSPERSRRPDQAVLAR